MEIQKDIRLLIATGLYPPDIGGPATYSKMLEDQLCLHGIDVHVISFGSVRHLPKILRHVAFAWMLLRASKGKDAIYALDPVSVGVPAYLISLVTRKPFWLRVAGDYAWEQGQLRFGVTDRLDIFYKKRFSYGFFVRILSFIEGFIARRAQVLILPCEYLRRVMDVWGVDTSRVHVVYSALFPLVVPDSRESIRARLGYTGTVIVSSGRLVPNKGFRGLIEVFSQIVKEKAHVTLVIVGDGPQEDELKQLVTAHKLEHAVSFTGKLKKEELGQVIKSSDIFVLNTEHEGFSHQLLEVMDLGVPIVTTNVGGNPELIRDGDSGILVSFDDQQALKTAIVSLVDNEALVERFTESARQRTKDFEQNALVSRLVTIIKENLSH